MALFACLVVRMSQSSDRALYSQEILTCLKRHLFSSLTKTCQGQLLLPSKDYNRQKFIEKSIDLFSLSFTSDHSFKLNLY